MTDWGYDDEDDDEPDAPEPFLVHGRTPRKSLVVQTWWGWLVFLRARSLRDGRMLTARVILRRYRYDEAMQDADGWALPDGQVAVRTRGRERGWTV